MRIIRKGVKRESLAKSEQSGRLTAPEVLGIAGIGSEKWVSLRSIQYSRLSEAGAYRVTGNAIACMTLAWLFVGHAAWWAIIGWTLLLTGVIYRSLELERRFRYAQRRSLKSGEYLEHAGVMTAHAALWSVPIIALAVGGSLTDLLVGWLIVMTLVVGSALGIVTAPICTIILCGLTSASLAFGLIYQGFTQLTILPPIFFGLVTVGTIEKSRMFLAAKIAEAGVEEKNQVVSLLLREFEENGADWLWQIDSSRRLRSVSPRFAYALNREPHAAEGESFVELLAGKTWETGKLNQSLGDLAEKLNRRESFANMLVCIDLNGRKRWWELSGTPILDERNQYVGFRGVGSDVTEQRESSEKIAYLARYDTLTRLPNRLLLNETLNEALDYAGEWRTRCAFLMLDLDRFKAVNDTLGHQVGDKLLEQVGERLTALMGENEMCGRLGGDEFGVVIRDLSDAKRITELSQQIIKAISAPYNVDDHMLYVGTSVGSAIGPRDGKTVEELMRNADLALYQAKDLGGAEHCGFEPSLHALAEEQRQLEDSLRSALDNDEFELVYQPVVDANGETVVSFEALLRWNSRLHGHVSPVKFIPMAEETRLILPIGKWVLREACRRAMQWPPHVMVNVNVAPPQLLEPGFAKMVEEILDETGLPADRLEIEVTESVFLSDATVARTALESIMSLGCSVALDDFGTGYSSLGYLRTLRFSTIKVDRLFVQGAAQGNRESLAIIRAVVAMTESLGMTTTAEGVENADEAALIRGLGCTKIQGYYFGRPMAAREAISMLHREATQRSRIA